MNNIEDKAVIFRFLQISAEIDRAQTSNSSITSLSFTMAEDHTSENRNLSLIVKLQVMICTNASRDS
jgi:hypothetical protein